MFGCEQSRPAGLALATCTAGSPQRVEQERGIGCLLWMAGLVLFIESIVASLTHWQAMGVPPEYL